MSSSEVLSHDADYSVTDHVDSFQYRPLSTAALASVVFGLVSTLTFWAGNTSLQACLLLCPIPVVGLICGYRAFKTIRESPTQFSGLQAAVAGTVMSTLGLVGGLSYAGYVHATEVPPGYERLAFGNLRPDDVEKKGSETIPRDVKELDTQQVFIKGYMRPNTHVSKGNIPVSENISKFLLVRDSAECCFGDISTVKYYDKMEVLLADGVLTDYRTGIFRVAGKLQILLPDFKKGRREPVYRLDADYIK